MKFEIINVLQNLTGQFWGDNTSAWRSWWKWSKSGKKTYFPRKTGEKVLENPYVQPKNQHFAGAFIPYPFLLFGQNPIFICDSTDSMKSAVDANTTKKQIEKYLEKNPNAKTLPLFQAPAGKNSKFDKQKELLKEYLENIPKSRNIKEKNNEDSYFNLIWFGTEVKSFCKKMVHTTSENIEKVNKTIDNKKTAGFNNSYETIKRAFEIAIGAKKGYGCSVWRNKNANLFAETFILFSDDWMNTFGAYQNKEKLLRIISEWNKTLDIRIHTRGFGLTVTNFGFLKELAKQNSGQFMNFDKQSN